MSNQIELFTQEELEAMNLEIYDEYDPSGTEVVVEKSEDLSKVKQVISTNEGNQLSRDQEMEYLKKTTDPLLITNIERKDQERKAMGLSGSYLDSKPDYRSPMQRLKDMERRDYERAGKEWKDPEELVKEGYSSSRFSTGSGTRDSGRYSSGASNTGYGYGYGYTGSREKTSKSFERIKASEKFASEMSEKAAKRAIESMGENASVYGRRGNRKAYKPGIVRKIFPRGSKRKMGALILGLVAVETAATMLRVTRERAKERLWDFDDEEEKTDGKK